MNKKEKEVRELANEFTKVMHQIGYLRVRGYNPKKSLKRKREILKRVKKLQDEVYE